MMHTLTRSSGQFSILIPTRNRYDDLCICLRSIAGQSLPPREIVIVDSSPAAASDVAATYQAAAGEVPVRYRWTSHEGLPTQRNQALDLAARDSTYYIFLDDDVILEPHYCAELVSALDADQGVIGAVGLITNWQGQPRQWWAQALLYFFLMQGPPGRVLISGQNGNFWEDLTGPPFAIDWVYGGGCILRQQALGSLRFDPTFERFGGYAFHEDLDFGYALGRRGRLLCVPAARMVHKGSPTGRPTRDYRYGISQVANRALFVQKHLPGPAHFACYLWSMLGQMLLNALMIARGRSPTRLIGNLLGLALVLTGQIRPSQKDG
jgi:GT2 family glycosyltransferase